MHSVTRFFVISPAILRFESKENLPETPTEPAKASFPCEMRGLAKANAIVANYRVSLQVL